jgi:hypothetical protein
MLVVSTHTERAVETIDVPHVCASCGVMWTLRMRAEGVGSSAFLIGAAQAKARATTSARADAEANARLARAFVGCSACGHSLLGRRHHWLVRLLPAFALLIVAGLVAGWVYSVVLEDRPFAWRVEPERFAYGGIVGAVMCGVVLSSQLRDRSRALDAAKTIKWFRGEPPDKPYVGCRCATCANDIGAAEMGERCPQCGAPTHHEQCARDHAFSAHGRDDQGAYRRPRVEPPSHSM